MIKREGFGADDMPDLLYINSKIIDHVGHLWSVNSPEMQDALHWQDAGLKEFIGTLNKEVGHGNWVMVVTADHGHQFDPAVSGAFQITPAALLSDLEARFDTDGDSTSVIVGVRTSQTFLNMPSSDRTGHRGGGRRFHAALHEGAGVVGIRRACRRTSAATRSSRPCSRRRSSTTRCPACAEAGT